MVIEQLWGTQERILICLARGLNAKAMIESGRRNAERFHGELFTVYIRDDRLSEKDEIVLKARLNGSGAGGSPNRGP
jgi:K+-sensing histidine kinase KdpD